LTFIRQYYDRVSAIVAGLFLSCSLLLILWSGLRLNREFARQQTAPFPKSVLPLAQPLELKEVAVKLRQPVQWTFSGRSGLFVPEKHFIDASGLPTTLLTTEAHPPVPNEWLEQFGLPITEGDVLNQDPDGDGFSNLEEWQSKTDPTDRNSHPAFFTKLRMKSFVQEPFRLVFASWVDDTFAINTNDLKEPTQFLRLGDSIKGTKFRLVRFAPKFERNRYGTRIDVSELTLENGETGEELTLVKERIMVSPDSVAHFVYGWSGYREFAVKKDQEFSLKPDERVKYKLVDVQSVKAVIVDIQQPTELIEIGLLSP